MENETLGIFKDIINTQGIDFHVFAPPYDNVTPFDGGIRNQLYEIYDYNEVIASIAGDFNERTLYKTADEFEVRYIIFKVPAHAANGTAGTLAIIGPYLLDPCDAMIPEIIERNKLPLFHTSELKNYYYGVPLVADRHTLDAQIYTLAGYLFGGDKKFEVDHTGLPSVRAQEGGYRIDPNNALSMSAIEERYNLEDELLTAIEQGDHKKALLLSQTFQKHRMAPRHADKLRERKNYLIVCNTLFRKAVRKAEVHPAHIDGESAAFAKRIEASRSEQDLSLIYGEMIRRYCRLVENHSLRGYSPNIQRVINYIDFNLTETLALNHLATLFSINPSYLSDQFRRETGKTITDYIMDRRIQSAVFLLHTTDLPIAVIGEKVGFEDENYFSRVFKRVQHKTPREYRKSFR